MSGDGLATGVTFCNTSVTSSCLTKSSRLPRCMLNAVQPIDWCGVFRKTSWLALLWNPVRNSSGVCQLNCEKTKTKLSKKIFLCNIMGINACSCIHVYIHLLIQRKARGS
jgi:hypothetical protein